MNRRRGVTLIELMAVVAIVSVLSALAAAGIRKMTANSAPQSAAAQLSAVLALGRSRAAETSNDVYLIVYPEFDPSMDPANAASLPPRPPKGSYFLLEDRNGGFRTGAGNPPKAAPLVTYATFSPGTHPRFVTHPANADGVILEEVYLADFPQRTVRFGATGTLAFPAPFTGVGGACSFCTGAGAARRGAIVFHADGTTEFLASDGTAAPTGAGTAAGRSASLGLVQWDPEGLPSGSKAGLTAAAADAAQPTPGREYLFAISSAAGKIALVKK